MFQRRGRSQDIDWPSWLHNLTCHPEWRYVTLCFGYVARVEEGIWALTSGRPDKKAEGYLRGRRRDWRNDCPSHPSLFPPPPFLSLPFYPILLPACDMESHLQTCSLVATGTVSITFLCPCLTSVCLVLSGPVEKVSSLPYCLSGILSGWHQWLRQR